LNYNLFRALIFCEELFGSRSITTLTCACARGLKATC
jgi:hypothetical protein